MFVGFPVVSWDFLEWAQLPGTGFPLQVLGPGGGQGPDAHRQIHRFKSACLCVHKQAGHR
jgi:hypothetical protein